VLSTPAAAAYSITSSARAKRYGHLDRERFCGLQIDDQLESARLEIGNFARLLSLEDPVDLAAVGQLGDPFKM
jgi:hypothetical protein